MSIQLNKPYKILSFRQKRYQTHYSIPAADVLVVPVKVLGDESSCDVRWEDANGELHHLSGKIFVNENLIALNPMLDDKLHELWKHYYQVSN